MYQEEERIDAFIRSLESPGSKTLELLEKEAAQEQVPIICPQMRSFLKVFLKLKQPGRILEIGTAIGYSALMMAEQAPADCLIVTIENNEKRIGEAKKHFAASPFRDRITLLEGDAMQILPQLGGGFDLIFVDGAKAQYINYLPEVIRLLADGGVLVSDNVFQEGDILESRYAVQRRNRTIHKRMREYLYELTHDARLITSIVPVGDGAAVSVKCQGDPDVRE